MLILQRTNQVINMAIIFYQKVSLQMVLAQYLTIGVLFLLVPRLFFAIASNLLMNYVIGALCPGYRYLSSLDPLARVDFFKIFENLKILNFSFKFFTTSSRFYGDGHNILGPLLWNSKILDRKMDKNKIMNWFGILTLI